MPEYTQKQKQYIAEHDPNPTQNISFHREKALMIDMLILFEEEGKAIGINTVSAIHHEACRCLLHHGLDWRSTSNDNAKLDEILSRVKNINTVTITGDVKQAQDVLDKFEGIDDDEGFVLD